MAPTPSHSSGSHELFLCVHIIVLYVFSPVSVFWPGRTLSLVYPLFHEAHFLFTCLLRPTFIVSFSLPPSNLFNIYLFPFSSRRPKFL